MFSERELPWLINEAILGGEPPIEMELGRSSRVGSFLVCVELLGTVATAGWVWEEIRSWTKYDERTRW